MLRLRLITGPLLIALLLGAVWLDGRLDAAGMPPGGVLLVIALLAAGLAALEITAVLNALGVRTSPVLAVIAGLVGVTMPWLLPLVPAIRATPGAGTAIFATVPIALLAAGLLTAVRGRRITGATLAGGGTLVAFVYPALSLGLLLSLRHEHSAWWIVGIVMTTKACDIGAYFTGHAIGRRKLIPWLSPGKTWEGLVGGVLLSGTVGAGLAAISSRLPDAADHVPVVAGLGLGLLFGAAGQLGDLAMSLLKRDAGLKDSSRILPGMGGVMDVLDSPALVAPLAVWLLPLLAGG